jgi:hypothetical protein|tara:strand:- start:1357 stop:1659 length:303 start_codon:yes stop_codon:yes gene_type:complete
MTVNKKIIFLILSLIPLNSCVQSSAFIGPAVTIASTGNVYQAGLQYGTNEAIKKETGKDTVEYISTVLNPPKKKTVSEELAILVEKRIKKTRKIIFSEKN